MLNFPLTFGDKYDGRCAEIYITEKQFLVYHCSVCEEIYSTFNELFSHITKYHYETAKEYKEELTASVEIQIIQESEKEEQVIVKEVGKTLSDVEVSYNHLELSNNSSDFSEDDGEAEENIKYESFMLDEITILEDSKETVDLQCDTSKSPPQRKKSRITGMLKSNLINRTKLNPLTRYQPPSNNVERKYICGICGFAFKERFNLRGHLLRHSNQKNFSCSLCTKKFFTKIELRLHECRHKGERPYLCKHCGMGFVNSGSLTLHIKKHHSLHRPFKCENCDKTFPSSYQLKNHMPVHSNEHTFQCSECLASFKMKKTLNNHLKMHDNKRKLRCEYCDLGFGTESALKTHLRKKHDVFDFLLEHHIEGDDEAVEEAVGKEETEIVHICDGNEFIGTLTNLDNVTRKK